MNVFHVLLFIKRIKWKIVGIFLSADAPDDDEHVCEWNFSLFYWNYDGLRKILKIIYFYCNCTTNNSQLFNFLKFINAIITAISSFSTTHSPILILIRKRNLQYPLTKSFLYFMSSAPFLLVVVYMYAAVLKWESWLTFLSAIVNIAVDDAKK